MSLKNLSSAATSLNGALNKVSATAGKLSAKAKKLQTDALAAVEATGHLTDTQLTLLSNIEQMSVGFYSGSQQLVDFFHAADMLKKAYQASDVAAITYWNNQITAIQGVINTWMGPDGKRFDASTILSQYLNPSGGSRTGTSYQGTSGASGSTGARSGLNSLPAGTITSHLGTTGGSTYTDPGKGGSTTKGTLP